MYNITSILFIKDDYSDSLPSALESVINQTYKPKELIIIDSVKEKKDLRDIEIYQYLFRRLDINNIKWEVIYGSEKGSLWDYQDSLKYSNCDWIWFLKDSHSAEPNVLENLIKNIKEDVGAISSLVINPLSGKNNNTYENFNNIEFVKAGIDFQQCNIEKSIEVDYLDNTFLFRKQAAEHGYCMNLSFEGNRKHILFTYEMKKNNWKILLDSNCITWDYSQKKVCNDNEARYSREYDEYIFDAKMKEFNIDVNLSKLCVLSGGLGDIIAFSLIIPDLVKKYKLVVVSTDRNDLFEDFEYDNLKIIPRRFIKESDCVEYDIYARMIDWNWDDNIVEAYKKLYGI